MRLIHAHDSMLSETCQVGIALGYSAESWVGLGERVVTGKRYNGDEG